MLNVTEKAQEQIAVFFKDRESKPIRIFLSNGCDGPKIVLGLDDPTPQDSSFEFAGVQYLVEKNLLARAQPIEIDYSGAGFEVSSALELGYGCGGCGSSSSCCHH